MFVYTIQPVVNPVVQPVVPVVSCKRGFSGNGVEHTIKIVQRRARLVLRWVTRSAGLSLSSPTTTTITTTTTTVITSV